MITLFDVEKKYANIIKTLIKATISPFAAADTCLCAKGKKHTRKN